MNTYTYTSLKNHCRVVRIDIWAQNHIFEQAGPSANYQCSDNPFWENASIAKYPCGLNHSSNIFTPSQCIYARNVFPWHRICTIITTSFSKEFFNRETCQSRPCLDSQNMGSYPVNIETNFILDEDFFCARCQTLKRFGICIYMYLYLVAVSWLRFQYGIGI